jgi:ATP-dependent Lon protease
MSDARDLGLFPLEMVLLPGERVPLHIFEPRYRQLFADCTLEDRPFVLVLTSEEGTATVGCAARFDTLVRRFEDGRMNVIAVGVEPVEIVEETSGRDYATATVRVLADGPAVADPALAEEVRALFRDLSSRVTGTPRDLEPQEGLPLSYAVAGVIDLEPEIKQDLLEQRNETKRLARVRDILRAAGDGMGHAQVAAERASRNGKVTHP